MSTARTLHKGCSAQEPLATQGPPPPAVIVAVPEGSAVLLTSQILTVVVFTSLELAQWQQSHTLLRCLEWPKV